MFNYLLGAGTFLVALGLAGVLGWAAIEGLIKVFALIFG